MTRAPHESSQVGDRVAAVSMSPAVRQIDSQRAGISVLSSKSALRRTNYRNGFEEFARLANWDGAHPAPEVARLRRCVGRSRSSGRAPARGVVVRVHPRRDTGIRGWESKWRAGIIRRNCNALRKGGAVFSSALKKIPTHRVNCSQARICQSKISIRYAFNAKSISIKTYDT